jgi:hypothetical protein
MNSKDAIRILARRFVSLSPPVRVQVAAKLLRFGEDSQTPKEVEKQSVSLQGARRKSFLEQFWDEVEAAHNDGLYRSNPFAEKAKRPVLYGLNPEQFLAKV